MLKVANEEEKDRDVTLYPRVLAEVRDILFRPCVFFRVQG